MASRKKATLMTFASIIFVEQIFRVIQGNIDILVLGRVSHDAVAAVGVVNQLIALSIVIISIASIGTNILLAQYVGEQKQRKVSAVLMNGFYTALGLAIILTLVAFFFSNPILSVMGLEGQLLKYGDYFLRIVSISLCLHAINMVCLVYLRNLQQKKLIILTLFGVTIVNLTGNIISVYLFSSVEKILISVAVMTVISHLLTCLVYSYALMSRKIISFGSKTFNLREMKEITAIGTPSSAEHFSYLFFQLFLSWVVIQWGVEQLQAKTYMQSWSEYIFLLSITIGQATQILVGQKIGERKTREINDLVRKSVIINVILTTTVCIFLLFISGRLVDFYDLQADITQYITPLILLTLILEPLRAINVNMVSSLYASRDTAYPMIISIISLWVVMVPLILIFNLKLNVVILWIIMIIDELFRAILLTYRWKKHVTVKLQSYHYVQKEL